MKHRLHAWGGAIAALILAIVLNVAPASAQQPQPAPTNPTANAASEEQLLQGLKRIDGRITIPDSKAAILQQPQGRDWRAFHEEYLPWIGGVAVVGVLLVLVVVFFIYGPIGAHDQMSSEKIKRFNWFERFTHWITAITFVILAISGLNYIFGKRLLQPLIGPEAFTAWSQWAKYAHNFLSWPFMVGVVLMFVLWVRDNIPDRTDIAWIKGLGGLRHHVDAGRFNAGQKGVFWLVVLGGLLMSVTGILLLFPFSAADINGMQWSQGVHAILGVLFIAAMIAHIYIGSLGMKGAYDAMGSGEVSITWAEAHHKLWVEKEQARNASGPQLPRPAPAE